MQKQSYNAYHKAAHTVSKTKQVVMLYDGIIRNVQQAKAANEQGQIEERFNKLVRAAEIIMGLQACLDFDQGGEAAKVLFDFYSSIDMRISALHRSKELAPYDELITELKDMRAMWDRFDRGDADAQATAPVPAAEPQAAAAQGEAPQTAEPEQQPVPVSGGVILSA